MGCSELIFWGKNLVFWSLQQQQELHWWLINLIGNSEDTQNILIGVIWIRSTKHEMQMKKIKARREFIFYFLLFVVVVVVCGIVEAGTNLTAQTTFSKISFSLSHIALDFVTRAELRDS